MVCGQGGFDGCFRTNLDHLQQTILKILDTQDNAAEVTMMIKIRTMLVENARRKILLI